MKKVKYLIFFILALFYTNIYASKPGVVCTGLPGCTSSTSGKEVFSFISTTISFMVKYVAVISVISIFLAGIFYIISIGEDEKAKKAKDWILWSLVGVIISISAWSLINLLNTFSI